MVVFAIVFAAVLASSGQDADEVRPEATIEYYQAGIRSVAQCRFRDGEKALLFKTADPKAWVVVHRLRDGFNIVWPVTPRPDGMEPLEINGGMASHASYFRVIQLLRRKPQKPVTTANIQAFLAKKQVPLCPWPTFYWRPYGNWHPPRGTPP